MQRASSCRLALCKRAQTPVTDARSLRQVDCRAAPPQDPRQTAAHSPPTRAIPIRYTQQYHSVPYMCHLAKVCRVLLPCAICTCCGNAGTVMFGETKYRLQISQWLYSDVNLSSSCVDIKGPWKLWKLTLYPNLHTTHTHTGHTRSSEHGTRTPTSPGSREAGP